MRADHQSPAARPHGDALGRALDLLDEGVTAANLGMLSDSVRLLQRALEEIDQLGGPSEPDATGRDRLRARILLSLSFPQQELGHAELAREAFAAAQRLAARGGHSDIEVLVHAQRGALELRSGRLAASLVELDRAESLLAHASALDQFKILLNRGELHGMLGHLGQAKADSARAVEVAVEGGLGTLRAYATHNLGLFEFLSGHLPEALQTMPTVEDMGGDYERGVVGMDRAKVLMAAGLTGEADRVLDAACSALARTELVQFLAEAELTRAEVALLIGDSTSALRLSSTAVARLEARSNHRATALAQLVRLRAEVAVGAGRRRIGREAGRLTTTFTELGLVDQQSYSRLIAVHHSSPRGRSAVALPRIRSSQPLSLRLYSHLVRADLAFDDRDVMTGRRHARLGLSELAEHQAQFGSLDLQTSSAAHGVALASLAITEEVAAGRPTAVLNWLERARAISTRVPEVRPPEDEETAELLGQLRWIVGQIDKTQAEDGNTDALTSRRLALQHTIRARSWTAKGSSAVTTVPSSAAIRAKLGPASLVAVFAVQNQLHGLVLTTTRCRLYRLGALTEVERLAKRVSADLDALALDRVPPPLRDAAGRSLTRGLRTLDELLVAPLDLPDGPVVLLPPGRFAGLPWGRLPHLAGRPATVAPSASAWMRAHEHVGREPGPVVAVAGPRLARADAEAHSVAAAWPECRALVGPEATGARVLSAMDGARIVHLAAHGQHQPDSPLFSALTLFDGPLVGYDLERLQDPPQQVVLSACDLGQATVRPGDEALGMTRALLHNGISTVISGVAKVSDRGAAELMVDYHGRLAAGSPPAYALADALAATDEPLPFVCFGAGW